MKYSQELETIITAIANNGNSEDLREKAHRQAVLDGEDPDEVDIIIKGRIVKYQSNVAVPPMLQKKYFVVIDNAPVGPLNVDELKQKIALKEVSPESLVWYQGLPGWAQAKTLSEVNILFSQVPPEMSISEPQP